MSIREISIDKIHHIKFTSEKMPESMLDLKDLISYWIHIDLKSNASKHYFYLREEKKGSDGRVPFNDECLKEEKAALVIQRCA